MPYKPAQLYVRTVTGGITCTPKNVTTGEDLKIYPNLTDTTTYIRIRGASTIELNSATDLCINPNGVSGLVINYAAPDVQIATAAASNRNLALLPDGTGKLKFGTWTGAGDAATNGSIAILDAAGNARKLATVA